MGTGCQTPKLDWEDLMLSHAIHSNFAFEPQNAMYDIRVNGDIRDWLTRNVVKFVINHESTKLKRKQLPSTNRSAPWLPDFVLRALNHE